MRSLALLALVCGLLSICAARDAAPQSSPSRAMTSLDSDWVDSSVISQHDFVKLQASDRSSPDREIVDSERDGVVTCYTMHIFGVKREGGHSDVTEPDGQWTCRRASKYGVKSVEEREKSSSH